MDTREPIPNAALDDRLAFVGTSGSGKTFAAKGRVETLLEMRHRVVIVDPLDVWFGLRLELDGKTPAYDVAIFGGKHADLPLNEHAGAIIGEAIATSSESCILSLASLRTSASRQRFMLAFLDALYECTDPDKQEPYHVVFDEADLWAPQRPMGNEAMLCHLMEEIVRRGRVKGFIPWLISQRPAVLNKNVLSQADGLVAMSLTSSQDRDAIGAWIEGQADRKDMAKVLADLPTLQRGHGVVWMPRHGILRTVAFPANKTFDSSRTPKRGEKKINTVIAPLNIDALRAKLSTVELEAKANDPTELKKRVADLTRQLQDAQDQRETEAGAGAPSEPDPAALDAEYQRGRDEGFEEGRQEGYRDGLRALEPIAPVVADLSERLKDASQFTADLERLMLAPMPAPAAREPVAAPARHLRIPEVAPARPQREVIAAPAPRQREAGGSLPGPQQRIVDAVRWWESVGVMMPTKVQVAIVAEYSPGGGAFNNPLGALRSAGLLNPSAGDGAVSLTREGRRLARAPQGTATTAELHAKIMAIVAGPQQRILTPLLRAYPRDLSKEAVAQAANYEPNGGAFNNPLGALRSLGLIDYPQRGRVVALPILFIEGKR
jgi:hypothetical protein